MNLCSIIFNSCVDMFIKTGAGICCVVGLAAIGCGSSNSPGGGDDPDTGGGGNDGGFGADIGGSHCPDGVTTRVTGTVYSPAKTNPDPLYNAAVFIPDGPVKKFSV